MIRYNTCLARAAFVTVSTVLLLAASGRDGHAQSIPRMETFNGNFFTLEKPRGWPIALAGNCTTFAWVVRDPKSPERQAFYFTSVGPFTLSSRQRQIDLHYMRTGGFRVPQIQFPVIEPPTPATFVARWQGFANAPIVRQMMPARPVLAGMRIVNAQNVPSRFNQVGGVTGLVRGIFAKGSFVSQGLFHVSMAPETANFNGPGANTGRAYEFVGVTASKSDFPKLFPALIKIVRSYRVTRTHVQNCIQQAGRQWQAVMRAGQTLRESSEIITKGWNARQKRYDIISEKYADGIRGIERLYDPSSGAVYEFPRGFTQRYQQNPDQFRKPGLKPLPPGDHKLWTAPTLNGPRALGF